MGVVIFSVVLLEVVVLVGVDSLVDAAEVVDGVGDRVESVVGLVGLVVGSEVVSVSALSVLPALSVVSAAVSALAAAVEGLTVGSGEGFDDCFPAVGLFEGDVVVVVVVVDDEVGAAAWVG